MKAFEKSPWTVSRMHLLLVCGSKSVLCQADDASLSAPLPQYLNKSLEEKPSADVINWKALKFQPRAKTEK